jgi:glycerophosphoryl diester phosphodiesterase
MDVLGHRGWPAPAHPENTLAAVAAALDVGASGVEVDVRLTADGVPVCVHDSDLRRAAGRSDLVQEMPYRELTGTRVFGGHRIPLLADVVATVADKGLLVLDIKPDTRDELVARRVAAALRHGIGADDVVVSSMRRSILAAVRREASHLTLALISVPGIGAAPVLTEAAEDEVEGVHLDLGAFLADPQLVTDARRQGLTVRCWTVNRRADAELASVAGVDGIITDHPADMLDLPASSVPIGSSSP